ncbi:hypothetical protein B0E54_00624 [Micromonospora sp. MH99]|nr:hypothetical protein [Micromonospora sp. MH99]
MSTRLIPASSALWMTLIESAGSGFPITVANISVPSAYGLTSMPVRPRVRHCMSVVHVDQEWDYQITVIAPDFGTLVGGLVDAAEFDGDD